MRTSRLHKETSRVVEALQSTPRRRTRYQIRNNELAQSRPEASKEAAVDIEDAVKSNDSPRPSRKRKLGLEAISTTDVVEIAQTTPRKAKMNIMEGIDEPGGGQRAKPKRRPAKQEVKPDGEVVVHAPPNWQQMYDMTAEMRKRTPAPVDTMGCETLAEEGLSDKDRRFQTLVALMLSSQTKDTTNALTMRRLQTELPAPGLTLDRILEVDPEYLNELIWAVGFHNNKTKYIKQTAEILRDKFDGDIPDTIEGLTSLPGVGPKMAYLTMSAAWKRDEGIGVDVHVHRITNLWGWHKTKNPEETRAALESWLPREKWHDINTLLVGFGQTICAPVRRKCDECTLSVNGLCPSAVVQRQTKTSRVKGKDDQTAKKIIKDEDVTVDGSIVQTTYSTDG